METDLEHILTSKYKDAMITFLNSRPECIEEAIELAVSDKQPYSWRAAWLLWSSMEENDVRIQKYTDKLISSVKGKKDGHQRELIKILYLMDLNEEQEGYIFDLCLSLWEITNKNPSVRYNAFRFIVKIAGKYPELLNEIRFFTQSQYMESLSPGVNRAISKMINKLLNKK